MHHIKPIVWIRQSARRGELGFRKSTLGSRQVNIPLSVEIEKLKAVCDVMG